MTEDVTPIDASATAPSTSVRLANLHEATRSMMLAESREGVARTAATAATDVLGFPLNTVRLYDPESDRLMPTAVSDGVEELAGERTPYERGETIQWEAFDGGEQLVFDDITEIDDDVPRSGTGSMLVAPLGEHGVLTLGSTTEGGIDPADVELARVLAANVEAAMDRARRRATLAERTESLRRKNERLDEFAAIVSHDLRNPLNVARGYVDLAIEEDDTEHLPAAAEALDRMDDLVDATLSLARQGHTVEETEETDLGRLAREAWAVVDAPGATLSVEDAPVVTADPERLRTLLENCLRNAVDHAGPEVTVEVGATADGFFVADDGPGIPEGDREKAFDRGYTTADDGTGFGLAIVADIARAHGWTVGVAESADGGLRLTFDGSR
ncbi:sensor histidine kinase [Halobaculum magnesiiphilum]|uniref:histidine kinase n=1 Tax=Halobaculum magnesiiphilum TaxID=1017351 RepID=A0A8T8WCU5_9EURY|nr:GAF domain-containing sensor histidine kinase [Halobaculum magnesiiphilum]QZP37669.1 GAF domain-containing sensor histidine kinase [Halobaculum magnesiiphilum]